MHAGNHGVSIRLAEQADLHPLRSLAISSFDRTYRPHFPAHILDPYMESAFSEAALATELADPLNCFLLALDDASLAGYLKLRVGERPDCISQNNALEVERIYADPAFKRRGIGSALMTAAESEAAARGFREIWLGVWEHNTDAAAFYQARGFQVFGKKIFMMGEDAQTDLVMVRRIQSGPLSRSQD